MTGNVPSAMKEAQRLWQLLPKDPGAQRRLLREVTAAPVEDRPDVNTGQGRGQRLVGAGPARAALPLPEEAQHFREMERSQRRMV